MTTVLNVLKTIANDKSLVLFNTIALSDCDSDICIRGLELTRKQYYSRLSALLKAGVVKRVSMHLKVTANRHAVNFVNRGKYDKKTGLKERSRPELNSTLSDK